MFSENKNNIIDTYKFIDVEDISSDEFLDDFIHPGQYIVRSFYK